VVFKEESKPFYLNLVTIMSFFEPLVTIMSFFEPQFFFTILLFLKPYPTKWGRVQHVFHHVIKIKLLFYDRPPAGRQHSLKLE
jgi:hypothetical protein